MEADLFPWRGRGSYEFFDGSEDFREVLVVLLLEGFDFTSEIAIRIHKSAELHERAHDCDVDRYSTSTAENARQHSDALLGERVGQRIGSAILLGWVTICDHMIGRLLGVVTICDRMVSNSFLEIRNAKSSGKRDAFRRMAWLSALVVTP